jgi:anti-anti-sigma factor
VGAGSPAPPYPGRKVAMSTWIDVDRQGYGVVTVRGDADLTVAPKVERDLLRLVDGGVRSLVVDLKDTAFIDSSMLRVFVGVSKELGPDAELVLVCPDRNIRKILEITLLDRVFRIVRSRDAALAEGAADGARLSEAVVGIAERGLDGNAARRNS